MSCVRPVMGIHSRFTFCSYALPGRTLGRWRRSLRSLIKLRPESLAGVECAGVAPLRL